MATAPHTEPSTSWFPHTIKPVFTGWYETRPTGILGTSDKITRTWWDAQRRAWFDSPDSDSPMLGAREWRGVLREVPARPLRDPPPATRCFACARPFGRRARIFLIDTRDDQLELVGSDCIRHVEAAGPMGYQPPLGGPRLYLPTLAQLSNFS